MPTLYSFSVSILPSPPIPTPSTLGTEIDGTMTLLDHLIRPPPLQNRLTTGKSTITLFSEQKQIKQLLFTEECGKSSIRLSEWNQTKLRNRHNVLLFRLSRKKKKITITA